MIRTRFNPMGGGLPYQKLQYLESTGVQHVNTGLVPDVDTDYTIVFRSAETRATKGLFGEYSASGFCTEIQTSTGVNIRLYHTGTEYIPIPLAETGFTQVAITGHQVYVDGVLQGTIAPPGTTTLTTILFSLRVGSNITQYCGKFSVSRFAATNSQGQSVNLIPVLWKANTPYVDGNTGNTVTPAAAKPGMYDTVSGKLFVNQGSGEFLYA